MPKQFVPPAEWQGGHVMPTGDALMAGYYLNELLLTLLALLVQYLQLLAILEPQD